MCLFFLLDADTYEMLPSEWARSIPNQSLVDEIVYLLVLGVPEGDSLATFNPPGLMILLSSLELACRVFGSSYDLRMVDVSLFFLSFFSCFSCFSLRSFFFRNSSLSYTCCFCLLSMSKAIFLVNFRLLVLPLSTFCAQIVSALKVIVTYS